MEATESTPFISEELQNAVCTTVDSESPVFSEHGPEQAARESWQRIIDHQLIEWGRNPSQLADEGVEPPSAETIQRAILLAEACRDNTFPPPNSVVPDPNGGIVFERREREVSEVFHIWDDGSVEYCGFQGLRLVDRWTQ